jgi:uncharacterized membrane protein
MQLTRSCVVDGVADPRGARAPARRMHRTGWALMTLLSLAMVALASQYLRFDPSTYFAEQREIYIHRELVLGFHITGGMLAMATGPFQFAARLRRRSTRLHRTLGVVYVVGVTVGALAGLALATTAHGGVVASLGFMSLALCWLVTTWTALAMLLAGRIADHRRWMVRSFSLTLAAVMLRLLLTVYGGLAGAGLVSFSFTTAYIAIAWLCWVPNLAVAILLTSTRSRTPAGVGEVASSRGRGEALPPPRFSGRTTE